MISAFTISVKKREACQTFTQNSLLFCFDVILKTIYIYLQGTFVLSQSTKEDSPGLEHVLMSSQ